jgi:hypothetical protein
LKESGNTPGITLPSGTLPENGLWLRVAPGLLDWLGLPDALLPAPLLLYEGELDGAVAAGVRPWPNAGQRKRRLARTHRTARQAKGILLCRNWFLGLRSFIDDKQGHKQPKINVMLIQAAAL